MAEDIKENEAWIDSHQSIYDYLQLRQFEGPYIFTGIAEDGI